MLSLLCVPKQWVPGNSVPWPEAWGCLQGETFLEAASEAGLQGAQPLPGGLGGAPLALPLGGPGGRRPPGGGLGYPPIPSFLPSCRRMVFAFLKWYKTRASTAGGAGGRSPLAGGAGVSPACFLTPLLGPPYGVCFFKLVQKRGLAQQGVPGDAVPWSGARGCPPLPSSPLAARRRRAASSPRREKEGPIKQVKAHCRRFLCPSGKQYVPFLYRHFLHCLTCRHGKCGGEGRGNHPKKSV